MDEKHEEEEFENTYDFPGTKGQEDVKRENSVNLNGEAEEIVVEVIEHK